MPRQSPGVVEVGRVEHIAETVARRRDPHRRLEGGAVARARGADRDRPEARVHDERRHRDEPVRLGEGGVDLRGIAQVDGPTDVLLQLVFVHAVDVDARSRRSRAIAANSRR
jgi:hypothetical protein